MNGEESDYVMGIDFAVDKLSTSFTQEQLDKALLDNFDLMRRVLLSTYYLIMGEAAKCLHEVRGLDCDGIDVAIERRYLTPEVLTTFRDFVKAEIRDDGFEYEFESVPVRVQFIDGIYDYFKYADQRFYGPETYKIPNPFEKYYKERHLIK